MSGGELSTGNVFPLLTAEPSNAFTVKVLLSGILSILAVSSCMILPTSPESMSTENNCSVTNMITFLAAFILPISIVGVTCYLVIC